MSASDPLSVIGGTPVDGADAARIETDTRDVWRWQSP